MLIHIFFVLSFFLILLPITVLALEDQSEEFCQSNDFPRTVFDPH